VAPRIAQAQTCPDIDLSVNPTVNRYLSGGDDNAHLYPFRPKNEQPTWLEYRDCKADINLEFTLLMSGLPCTDTIQVWAGTVDCTQLAARQSNSDQTHCWPVLPTGAFNMSSTSTANIRAQDIVQFITSAAPPELYTRATPTACQALLGTGSSPCSGVSLGLYFMAVEADGQTVDGTSAEYHMGALIGSPDDGGCSPVAVEAGATDAAGTGSSDGDSSGTVGGCQIAAGQGSDVGVFGGVGLAALVVGRRRRRTGARCRRVTPGGPPSGRPGCLKT
jgi:MYXO-CTERM domain-containing protein